MVRFAAHALSLSLLALTACGGSSSAPGGGGGGGPPAPIYDVAVGCRDLDTVVVYRDVLGQGATPLPAAILDNAGSQVDQPRSILFHQGRLLVANRNGGQILIFGNVLTLVSGQAPDVVLTHGIGVRQVLVSAADDLIAVSPNVNKVQIWRSSSTLAHGDPPDVELDSAGSLLQNPTAIAVEGDDLYVASYGTASVHVFRGLSTLASGQAPDASVSTDAPIELGFSGPDLIVLTQSGANLLRFANAAGLAGGEAPTSTLDAASTVTTPGALARLDDLLYVANRTGTGIVRFTGAAALATDQAPDTFVDDAEGVVACESLAAADGILAAAIQGEVNGSTLGGVALWVNAAAFGTGLPPSLHIADPAVLQNTKAVALRKR